MKINLIYKKQFIKDKYNKSKLKKNIEEIVKYVSYEEGSKIGSISVVFCSDIYIKEYNKEYLKHDYPTDIITFHDKNEEGLIEGDLLISVDTVKANAKVYKSGFDSELKRVVIHGVLHLCGYDDKTSYQKKLMRKKEDYFFQLF